MRVLAVGAASALLAALSYGCGLSASKVPEGVSKIACYVSVLEPVLGEELSERYVLEALWGPDPSRVLQNLGIDRERVEAMRLQWMACRGDAPVPVVPAKLERL